MQTRCHLRFKCTTEVGHFLNINISDASKTCIKVSKGFVLMNLSKLGTKCCSPENERRKFNLIQRRDYFKNEQHSSLSQLSPKDWRSISTAQ